MKLKTSKIIILNDFFILIGNHLFAGLAFSHQIDTDDVLVNFDQTTISRYYYL
jgi:hypothetical protein